MCVLPCEAGNGKRDETLGRPGGGRLRSHVT